MLETLTSAPGSEPLTRDEAKAHCRVTHTREDDLFDRWIVAAREYAETWTGRQLITATWELWLPCFWYATLEVPHAPLISVGSVKYYDGDNAQQTWNASNYIALAPSGPKARPGTIDYAYGVTTPTTYSRPDAVTVAWNAGYGAAVDVPSGIKAGMLLLVSEMNERREEVVVGTIQTPNVLRARDLFQPFVSHGSCWGG